MKKHEAKKKSVACAPANVGEYGRAAVYDRESFASIIEDEISISKVGKDVDEEELDFQGELGWAKLRYQLLKEDQEDEGIGDEVEEDDIKMTE